jgi:hypothetical protein
MVGTIDFLPFFFFFSFFLFNFVMLIKWQRSISIAKFGDIKIMKVKKINYLFKSKAIVAILASLKKLKWRNPPLPPPP